MYFLLQQTARANGLDPEKYVAKAIELAAFMDPAKDDYSALLHWNLGKEYDLRNARRFEPAEVGFNYAYGALQEI